MLLQLQQIKTYVKKELLYNHFKFNKLTKMELDEEYGKLNTRIKVRGLGNVQYELYSFGENFNSDKVHR